MSLPGASLRGTLGTYLPTWLGNVPGLRNLFSILWAIAAQGDMLREVALEGQFAAYPGVGTPTALPFIGASRGLIQGPSESDALFAKRLIPWLQTAALRGSARGLVLAVQAYLVGQGSLGPGVYPVVAFVDRAGNLTTANADQSVTRSIVSWDWDELGGWVDGAGYHPPFVIDGWWSDGWVLIQDPYTHYASFIDPAWLAAWNSGDQTFDSLCPQQVVTSVQAIVDACKGAHMFIRAIVWCPSPTAFAPTGYYGNASSDQSGTQAARRSNVNAYWQPPQGA